MQRSRMVKNSSKKQGKGAMYLIDVNYGLKADQMCSIIMLPCFLIFCLCIQDSG